MLSDLSKRIDKCQDEFIDIFVEAIYNSYDAGAKNIDIDIIFEKQNSTNINDIVSIVIEDNGIGFTNKNQNSFDTLDSSYKLHGKGIGRVAFLRYFKEVVIESVFKNENDKFEGIAFKFNDKFNNISDSLIDFTSDLPKETYTKITFNDPYNLPSDIETNINAIDYIKNELKNLILPLLIDSNSKSLTDANYKFKQSVEIKINKTDIKIHNDIECKNINIDNNKFLLVACNLSHKKHHPISIVANNRIINFSDRTRKNKPLSSVGIKQEHTGWYFLLFSRFFDDNVSINRDDIKWGNNKSGNNLLEILNNELRNDINSLINKNQAEIENERVDLVKKIKKIPMLADVDVSDLIGNSIGSPSKLEKVIKKGLKKKVDIYSKLLNHLVKDDKIAFEKINSSIDRIEQANAEYLAMYVFFRDYIIQVLKDKLDKRVKEPELHDIVMKRFTSDSGQDSNILQKSNMWLIDDKFMFYKYLASDFTIDKIKSDIKSKNKELDVADENDENNGIKPDIFIVLDRPEQDNEPKNGLIIEFKRQGAKVDLGQLIRYKDLLSQQVDKINLLHGYVIMELSEKIVKDLSYTYETLKPIYTTKGKSYIITYGNYNMSIILMDWECLANDAEARNKLFLDILDGKHTPSLDESLNE